MSLLFTINPTTVFKNKIFLKNRYDFLLLYLFDFRFCTNFFISSKILLSFDNGLLERELSDNVLMLFFNFLKSCES